MEYKILNNGVKMPMIGFGLYKVDKNDAYRVVSDAIKVGYRLFDTAQRYDNEEEVGNAIKDSGIDRSEFFITTKVWITNAGEEVAYNSVIDSMNKLGVDYLDMVLVHQPFNDYYGTYRALTKLYEEGKVRAIGVSNFYPDRLVDIVKFNKITPQVNQVETHVFAQQIYAHEIMRQYGVHHQAWSPLASGRNNLLYNETLTDIGKKYNKSAAQVALRYLLDMGVSIVVKSTHEERMRENLDVLDFFLSDEEKEKIHELNENTSVFFDHYDPETVEYLTR